MKKKLRLLILWILLVAASGFAIWYFDEIKHIGIVMAIAGV